MKYIKLFENIDWDWMDEEESDIPDEFKGNEDFYKFLVDNNALDKFLYNLKESGKNLKNHFIRLKNKFILLNIAFRWRDTTEGHDFWSNLNYKWKEYLRNKKKI
jgi:hypothetical protein